jgi:4-hydroxy-tetrahydrodipicolinate synthase
VQLALLPLIRALFAEVNPIPCKAAMEMMGLCGGEVRLPLVPIGEENRVKLRAALIDAGVEL